MGCIQAKEVSHKSRGYKKSERKHKKKAKKQPREEILIVVDEVCLPKRNCSNDIASKSRVCIDQSFNNIDKNAMTMI